MLVPARRARFLTLLLLPLGLALAVSARGADPVAPDGTRRMAERLRRIAQATDPRQNPFVNGARAGLIEASLPGLEPAARHPALRALAEELLAAGRTAEAIARLDQLEASMKEQGVDGGSREWRDLRVRQAVAHLRQGEEENCIEHHGAQSCIFPIRGAGIHARKRGSRTAAAILETLLEQHPGDLQARWLLNIAHMTLGRYPDGVPPRWLMPPELFASEHDIQRFADVAGQVGLDVDDLAGGSIVDDFDGDGYLDVLASAMGLRSQLRYFRNEADGTFAERTVEAGLTGLVGGLNVLQSDYDNDGNLDVLVLRGAWMKGAGRYPNSLLRNNGDGTFADVTEAAGLLSYHPTQTAAWVDYDADGWLDLFIGNESIPGDPHPCELYHNNGDGTFTECAQQSGLSVVDFVKGVTGGDYDNDGLPDLYLSVLGRPNRLYRNDGPLLGGGEPRGARSCRDWRFTDVASAAGVAEPIYSFPTWFWDYDNDGWEDLFVSGYILGEPGDVAADYLGLPHRAELPRLYRNDRDGTFTDVTAASGLDRLLLAMGANYGDLDGDGWLDFYAGTGNPDLGMLLPDRAFRNDGGRTFQDVTTSGGFGHLQKGHGVSFADVDNDGDQDIYHVLGGAFEADHFRNALYENPGHGNRWIALKLEGVRSNRPGVGARIEVLASTPAGDRAVYRTVRSGGSFGASPLRQEIGLGDATGIRRVEIAWPSGGPPQILRDLAMDRLYLVREGEARATPLPLRRLRLGGAD